MNRESLKALLLGFGAAALVSVPLAATAQSSGDPPSQTASSIPVYMPPLRGTTAGGRIGGGTRGTGDHMVTLSVLAPEHPGRTVNAQPRLYWYLSEPVDVPAELTVVERSKTDPVFELSIAPPLERGIHALDLGKHGVRLEPGVRYEWFVALVVDENQRSNDIVAGAEIELVALAAGLPRRVADAGEGGYAGVYAGAGIWYDAIDSASLLIARSPDNVLARAQRAALLDQVGLEHVAAWDRTERP